MADAQPQAFLVTLVDFFDRYIRGNRECVVYNDGFRTRRCSFDDVRAAAESLARRLHDSGLNAGDHVVIWSENRPEWMVAFWASVLRGLVIVPVDPSASIDLLHRIIAIVQPRAMFTGDRVTSPTVPPAIPVWPLRHLEWPTDARPTSRAAITSATVLEIVFTSGTTGDPKGVVITHGNVVANIEPIEREARKYRRWVRFAQPLRLLNLLPLSHMFGQALSLFLPPLIPSTVVFMSGHNPDRVLSQIGKERVVLLVAVPRLLAMLRDRVQRVVPARPPSAEDASWLRRRWQHRGAHHPFGWKFCGFVVGGAPLDADVEQFWRRLGFVVIQGYGLTETAPVVAWSHPFHTKAGTVGLPLSGVEVRIAPDGEVLVRGAAVSSGYIVAPGKTRPVSEDGWLHTGDVGVIDASGHLLIRGRTKDVIVTSEGLKVFPEDVERVLNALPGVRDAAVVGKRVDGGEELHAVLVLDGSTDPSAVVRDANVRLEGHQRIRDFSIWPGRALPRTEPLRKLKRYEIRAWIEGTAAHIEQPLAGVDPLERLLGRYTRGRITADATLEQLGLSSLDRIELLTALQEQTDTALSEAAVTEARTVSDLRIAIERASEEAPAREMRFPSFARRLPARIIRNASQPSWILPLARLFMRMEVTGREHLTRVPGPMIFAANHQSHFDTPAILSALPRPWRRSISIAMGREFFDPHFFRSRYPLHTRIVNDLLYGLAALFFNGFPLPRSGPGAGETLRYIGELMDDGWSVLIFPEGHRTQRGEISPFAPGVGLLASRLGVPVVPVRLSGLHRVLHQDWKWPQRGPVGVTFGSPMFLEGSDYAGLAARVEAAVRALRSIDAGAANEPHAA